VKKITVKVEGMRCGMCESHVNDLVRRNFNVKKVSSSHIKGETVIWAPQTIDPDTLIAVISADGYIASDVKEEEYKKKGLFSFLKK